MLSPNHHICPVCQTHLGSLRKPKKCSKCDFTTDSDTIAIEYRSWSHRAVLVTACLLGLFAVSGRPFGEWQPLTISLLALCTFLVWALLPQPKRRAVLGPESLALVEQNHRPRFIPRQQISHARWTTNNTAIELLAEDQTTTTTIEASFLGTLRQGQKLIDAIEDIHQEQTDIEQPL